MRPKRKKIKFDEESVNDLLQEIYNESHNIRNKIARLYSKWESKVKDGGEIAAIGDQIVRLITVEVKNQDQKIVLLKYLKEVVFENNKTPNSNNKNSDENETISTDRRNELLEMVNKSLKN